MAGVTAAVGVTTVGNGDRTSIALTRKELPVVLGLARLVPRDQGNTKAQDRLEWGTPMDHQQDMILAQ